MADGTDLFSTDEPTGRCGRLTAHGFSGPVAGTVYTQGAAGCGMPLGGLGTGYLELGVDGLWKRTTIGNQFLKPSHLDAPALALAVDGQQWALSSQAVPGIAAVETVAAWGHFPVMDLQFRGLPIAVDARLFCPFVPGDADASNIPAILGEVWLRNDSDADKRCRLLLNWPGLDAAPLDPAAPAIRSSVVDSVTGYQGVHVHQERGSAVLLAFLNPQGTVESGASPSQAGEWTGNAAQPCADGPPVSSSLSTELTVPAHSEQSVRFMLTWYTPTFRDSDNEPHRHRYSLRYKDALDVASRVAVEFANLRERTLSWQATLFSSGLPDWLQDSLINSLYSLAKNTLWLQSTRPDDWWGPQGLLIHSESFTGCPISETMVCRFHGHFPLLFLFPELELGALRAFAHFQLRSGEVPFSFGQPLGLNRPHYTCQHPINSTEFVQLVLRYVQRTGDQSVLQELYPAARDAFRFAMTLDTDDDGLVNDHPHALSAQWPESWPANQFYDIWPWSGTSVYVAGIGLAATQAALALADMVGDTEFAQECRALIVRAQASFQATLWTGNGYLLFTDPERSRSSDSCLANQLMALWCTRVLGLDDALPEEHVATAQRTIARLNMGATDWGVVNGCHPSGQRDESGSTHSRDIFVGESLCAAMTYLYTGQTEIGLEITRRLVRAIVEHQRMPWDQYCLIGASDGLPVWGSDYYSNLVIWAVPMALAQQDIATFVRPGGLIDAMLGAEQTALRQS